MIFKTHSTVKSLFLACLFAGLLAAPALAFEHFISRDGHQLKDGNEVFRFAGIHAPELHRIEDQARGKCLDDPRGWGQYFKWPTAQEQENWIQSLVLTGHKAMRVYVLSIATQWDQACERETHILPPNTADGMPRLNEAAMVHYDRMIALADKHGLRLILPFVDHWKWWGGRNDLAAFYGEHEDDFYDINSKTYAAYQSIIKQVTGRTNTFTGRKYNEEKAIMAWETGNELKLSNESFVRTTATLIKHQAPNQLVIDGTYLKVNEFSLSDPNVDIITNHFYTVNGNNNPEQILKDLKAINGKKVYFIGEFGLDSAARLNSIMQAAVHQQYNGAQAAGALFWHFRGHRHDGGYYWHKEVTGHYAYHLPGSPENYRNEEMAMADGARLAIAQMDGAQQMQPLPVPQAPVLRPIDTPNNFKWLGAPVGRWYRFERAMREDGPWQIIGDGISDGRNGFNPATDTLFADPMPRQAGQTYFYRVIAFNETGQSIPSNIETYTQPE
ncbi:beta-mannanase man5E [Neiella marina]|uniref:mannan endo-1,4-beta-mannosidase n=1 Tax=Neiella holothuriorum TaxID=2870530 RepID=A0ABS7EID3_9GAMM|nr:beta-mannanase man5E [Neiella holothuriorum]MBW8192114.1 beta-mannanase man5E [Neiella holothuriorum]